MIARPAGQAGRPDKPSVHNKETFSEAVKRFNPLNSHLHERAIHNRKRLLKVIKAKRLNNEMGKELDAWLKWFSKSCTVEQLEHLIKFRNRLGACCQHSLFREFGDRELEYIGSHTCNHKACNVCNMLRCRNVRRKYLHYFKANPYLLEKYDFTHLMLTVPHTAAGFRGERFYLRAIVKLFNTMRREKFWKERVWAGEYGVEFTRNEHGLHIHIHAMLLLPKEEQSRNQLYRWILLQWNYLTQDHQANRKEFSREDRAGILKGLLSKKHTLSDVKHALETFHRLQPSGSTIVHLESLYVLKKNGGKRYINPSNLEDFMKGVMECIKYHFAPFAMMKKGEGFDFTLLAELLPLMHKQPMYRKFGAWHKEKSLNLVDTQTPEHQVADTLAETGHAEIIHPTTAEVVTEDEVSYFITNPASLLIKPETLQCYTTRNTGRTNLPRGISTRQACEIMLNSSVPKRKPRSEPDDDN